MMDEERGKEKKERLGWCLYDWANSAFATVMLSAVLPVYFVSQVPPDGLSLPLPWSRNSLNASALWGYGISISMLTVALTAPWLGRLADRNRWRRPMFRTAVVLGALLTVGVGLLGPDAPLLLMLLFILANYCYAGGNIFYNAYLPELAGRKGMDRLSAAGFAWGYVGGGIALLLCILLIQFGAGSVFEDTAAATRAGFVLTGLWWLLFSLPALGLEPRPAQRKDAVRRIHGWNDLIRVAREILGQKNLCLFLLAFLCYNDGIQTIIAVSAVFAKEELGLSQGSILGCFLMIQFLAMPGALLFGRFAEKIGAGRALMLSLMIFLAVCLYAYGMESDVEFWVMGGVVALVLGGSQSLSRSLYSRLIPDGRNAEFFGFYAISSKFASVLGPLTFALVIDLTGSNRLSILALGSFFILGMLLLKQVSFPETEGD